VTAWLTLVGMWTGAGLTDRWLDTHHEPHPQRPGRRAVLAP
jgi:hypothetical protein